MTSLFERRALVALLFAATLLALAFSEVRAADADPAVGRIRTFYDTLLETMKEAKRLPVAARYEKLDPAVRAAFDLPAMTRIAVGPAWTTIDPAQQQALLAAFARFTIATYANRFDGYSGERFDVDPNVETRGANRIVHSTLVRTKGDPIALNYLVHATPDGWKATDVYLSGTISELATRRSEFGALLRDGGAKALVDSLQQRADKLLQG